MERDDPLRVRFLAGAIASSSAELATLPLDCSKVRMQTHGMSGFPAHTASSIQFNGGLFDTLRKVIQHEGVLALWSGARPAVVRQVAFYSVSMALYAPLRDSPHWGFGSDGIYLKKILAGGISGAIGIALANPYVHFGVGRIVPDRLLSSLDVIKVKMQNDRRAGGHKRTISEACHHIYATEGSRGFVRGIWPNIQRCFIVNGMEFGTYDQCKTSLVDAGLVDDEYGLGATIGASLLAGFAGAVASSPLDVIKTQLMAQPQGTHRQYSGVWDCGHQIYRREGLRAFYKGFTAYYLREAPWCCLFFVTYDLARNALVRTPLRMD
ncbi:Aste57867_22027 [Aphanomyces stellatus]|uniref:Aste57867_22027 protein n=1 Tax=Aphanomyces stellatus TaxID=120398 RepID=A0A485LKG4_9STRA|nr:hypothetical protein As57867_021958 [Aphanomyces stellatus]VFT98695.1 Aste57867_22027 [Aphanomyces stellatus]